MVTSYVPDAGDIVFLEFDPQAGREQAERRPALVLTDERDNRAIGIAKLGLGRSPRGIPF